MNDNVLNGSSIMENNLFLTRSHELFNEFNNVPVNEWMCNGMRFENCTFSGCNFKKWTFRSCLFVNCEFEGCDFSLTSFDSCKWYVDGEGPECLIRGSASNILDDCTLFNTRFLNCVFTLVKFSGMNVWDLCSFVNSILEHCYFPDQDLSSVKWFECDFGGMNFSETKSEPNIPLVCPETGSFIAYKKVIKGLYPNINNYNIHNYLRRWTYECKNAVIAKLEIPESALRCSSTSRKCRASKAKVLEFQDLDGNHLDISLCHSVHNPSFIYEVGNEVEVPDFDENRWDECSKGIHFFMTRDEAVKYKL